MRAALLGLGGLVAAVGVGAGIYAATQDGGEEEVLQNPGTPTTISGTPTESTASQVTPTESGVEETVLTFTDPMGNFSFEYPMGWTVIAPTPNPDVLGYAVTITSYSPEDAPGIGIAPPVSDVKIDIDVSPNPDNLPVQEWVSTNTAGASDGVTVSSQESTIIADEPAIERLVSVEEVPVREYFVGHEGNMYSIRIYTAESSLIPEAENLISSFRFVE